MDFLPVNPLLTKHGAIAALVADLGEDSAKPVPLQDKNKALTNFTIVSDALSVALAGKLGVGSIFSGATSAKDRGFFFDAMTFTDEYAEQNVGDAGVIATRWGVGIRVVLRVTEITANAALNFGLVGAAVELQQARARYEVTGIGIGVDGLIIVLEELPAIGDFRYETYQKLNSTVVKKLAQYLKTNKATLVPQPVGVAVKPPLAPLGNSRSVYFAMHALADRRTLGDALSRATPTLDRDTIRTVYAEVAGIDDLRVQPSNDAERTAESWLAV
jgi:hypothetical protein